MKIGFIGSGKMAEAIIGGILDSKILSPQNIFCSDISKERTLYLNSKYNISTFTQNTEIIKNANLIFLCVKPQDINKLKNDLTCRRHRFR